LAVIKYISIHHTLTSYRPIINRSLSPPHPDQYPMTRLSLLLLLLASIQTYTLHAQQGLSESPATIYFYRVAGTNNADQNFTLLHKDSIVGDIKSASIITYFCPPGQQEFWGQTTTRQLLILNVKPGKVYTIRCGISGEGAPTFRQVPTQTAADQMRAITAASPGNTISPYNRQSPSRPAPVTPRPNRPVEPVIKADMLYPSDTITALTRLYARKRTGGKIRAYIFAYFAGYSFGYTVATGDVSNIPGIVLFGGIAATGSSQVSRYSKANLQALLATYKSGIPLSEKIKRKLKDRDFRPLTEIQRRKMTQTN